MLKKIRNYQSNTWITAALFLLMTSLSHNALASHPDSSDTNTDKNYTGLWLTEDGETVVEIATCEDSLCGKIVGFNNNEESDKNLTEEEAVQILKDLALFCSTDLLGGVKKEGQQWANGWIFDFETDKKYDLNLALIKGILKVRAYEGSEAFGENFLWTRVEKAQISCTDILKNSD